MPRLLSVHIAMAVAIAILIGGSPIAGAELARTADQRLWTGANKSSGASYDGTWAEFPGGEFELRRGVGVYDPVANRMVFVGNSSSANSLEVWTLAIDDNAQWTQVIPIGAPPAMRWHASAIYDPLRNRLVMFGGLGFGGARNDVWALNIGPNFEWISLLPSGLPPSPRMDHSAVYDGIRDRMLVFAGANTDGVGRNDTYALSFSGDLAWSPITPWDFRFPPVRSEHVAVFDSMRDRMLVFGGTDWDFGLARNDVWVFSFHGDPCWTELSPAGTEPFPRTCAASIIDSARDRLIIHGGSNYSSPPWYNDVWELPLDGSEWRQLLPEGPQPPGDDGKIALYDSAEDRMITFSGDFQANALWVLVWSAPTAVPSDPGLNPIGVAFAYLGPNPFSAQATIRFQLRESGPVRLDVFDVSGRRVRELLKGTISEGAHEVIWDGRGDDGRTMPSAVYFFRLATESGTLVRKAVRIPSGD